MKRLMNAVDAMLDESLDGFAAAHADTVELGADRKFVRRRALSRGKVALISGGGSGHEPLHAGFVGRGMLDAACPGQVFTSPTPDQMAAAIEAVDTGAGSLLIVKNYEGDVMNFEMASELAAAEGRKIMTVVTNDDVAVPNSTWSTGRRGVAGTLVVEKIVGAGAEQSMKLAELQQLGRKVNDRTRSFGVALTPCTVPAAGKPTFELAVDEMEVSSAHPRRTRTSAQQAGYDAIAEDMLGAILGDLHAARGERMSSAGQWLWRHAADGALPSWSTPPDASLRAAVLKVVRHLTGSLVTSLDMAGCSLTVSLLDEPLIRLWDAPVKTAALSW